MFETYISRWNLVPDGNPVVTRSGRLLPVRRCGELAMLKLVTEAEERSGALLMEWWDGDGAARVLARDDNALLLERAEGIASLADVARATGAMTRRAESYALWRADCMLLGRSRHRTCCRCRSGSATWIPPLRPTAVSLSVLPRLPGHCWLNRKRFASYTAICTTALCWTLECAAGWPSIQKDSWVNAGSTSPISSQTPISPILSAR
jgi:Aminoglycoside/hydroxyurea antibiotic resistance kinase